MKTPTEDLQQQLPSEPVGSVRIQINWGLVIIATITGLLSAIPATLTAWAALEKAKEGLNKSQETHNLVNSRMTELLELTRTGAAAKATLVEKAAEEDRKQETVDHLKTKK